ncbi:hypothetical protein BV20DRAFT_582767 [Pilatotrama ljubarskyi]|nr:hypothetical protein BV20DRAFT_582767 [Pilatotrama ljubarskyi]
MHFAAEPTCISPRLTYFVNHGCRLNVLQTSRRKRIRDHCCSDVRPVASSCPAWRQQPEACTAPSWFWECISSARAASCLACVFVLSSVLWSLISGDVMVREYLS